MKKVTILHIFPDDKFFDGISDFYDQVHGIRNLYYFYNSDKNYSFKYIRNVHKVKLICNLLDYLKLFSRKDIDVVFFHSLYKRQFFLFPFIDSHKIVIWWSWGFDIYNDSQYYPALIPCQLYQPITKEYIKNNCSKTRKWYVGKPLGLIYRYFRKSAVKRVDYFIPCMPLDYRLMKEMCPFFHAEYFPFGMRYVPYAFEFKTKPQNILIGNSLSYTNNHLDILEIIYVSKIQKGRKIVIPVNYGNAFGGVENLKKITRFDPSIEVLWLDVFLDSNRYFGLLNTVTHAVFGVMRQQALANVLYCLRTGVKVYLYKESYLSKQLRELGYIFYSIDDDLNSESLSVCLDRECALNNYKVFMERSKGRNPDEIAKLFSSSKFLKR